MAGDEMPQAKQERNQWHPVLVDGLRYLMGDDLSVEPEHALARLPSHAEEYPFFLEQSAAFHGHALKEVLAMRRTSLEAYRKLANVKEFVDLVGPKILVEEIGEEKIIREIGEERVLEDLLDQLGPDRLRELLERKLREREQGNGADPSR